MTVPVVKRISHPMGMFQKRIPMFAIQKKIVVDEQGRPQEVLISWEHFQQISEMLGLDLDEEAVADLRQGQRDRRMKNRDAYVDLAGIQ